MVDVRGDVLRPPHGTTPAAVKSNIKSEMRSTNMSEDRLPQKETLERFYFRICGPRYFRKPHNLFCWKEAERKHRKATVLIVTFNFCILSLGNLKM